VKISYRPEIDGLRGIAVIAVILYHAKINIIGHRPFEGGFIGVDIFFVISGYLITSIILRELIITGSFSFRNFYERRVRRLLPVLLFVMMAFIPFAWLYLPPAQFIEFSKSIIYSIGFSSNNYFYYSGNEYGAMSAIFTPFLHSWSLSIEEQYYIIFPAILLVSYKFFKKYIFIILIILFTLSIFYAHSTTINDSMKSFYFLHTRVWELLVGSMLAYFECHNKSRCEKRTFNEICSFIGLSLIIFSLILFSSKSIFHPSFFTLIPIIGTSLIIWFANKGSLIHRLLSNKAIKSIGLISYSLYLWHYPFFSFAKIGAIVTENIPKKIILILIILLMSIFSYFFIEKKFRDKSLSFKSIIKILSTFVILLLIFNFIIIFKNGFSERFENLKNINQNYNMDNLYLAKKKNVRSNKSKSKFIDDKVKVLIVGDSHGYDLYNAFSSNKVLFSKYDFIKKDLKYNDIKTNKIFKDSDIVIFSYRWTFNQLDDFKKIIPTISKLKKKFYITSTSNEYKVYSKIFTLLDKKILFESEKINYFGLKNTYYKNRLVNSKSPINQKLKKTANKNGFIYLNKEDYMCDLLKKECDYVTEDGNKIFYDYGHYTLEGAKYFGKRIHSIKFFN